MVKKRLLFFIILAAYTCATVRGQVPILEEIRTFIGHKYHVKSVCFSPDGKYALSGSQDKTLKLWDVATGEEIRTFSGHTRRVNSVDFSPDGKYALSGSVDTTLKLWNVATGEEVRTFIGHTLIVHSVCFSPDGKYALSGSVDKTLKLWDVATGEEIRTFIGHTEVINSVCFSPDGKYALSGSLDKTLKLWEVATGEEIRTFSGHTKRVTCVDFSTDGKYALSGSMDSTLILWDVETGEKTRVFTDHNEMVFSACFSPDGKYVLSGSRANTLLWNVTTGQFKKIYAGWSAICFSHDGKYILSAENKGNLLLWKVSGEKDILEPYVKEFNLTAKLLKGKTVKKPLSNQKIHLKNQSNTTVQTQTTDEYGDFEFKNVDKSQQYTFELEQNPELKNEKVYLARQDGIVVGEFMAGTKGVFRFELLPAIIEKLELKKEEDVFVQLDDFVSSDKNEIVIVDDIYYETGKWDVLPQAAEKLNRVVASLKKNPQMRIELLAHTDSRDEAQANLVLSQKRAKSAVDYIVSKGIDIKRVSGKGYGETKILNHCTDGVNCSEKEHALNRRTEFKFFKS